MTTSDEITEHFLSMILGVQTSEKLTSTEKSYIIGLLQDQLKLELISLEYLVPV